MNCSRIILITLSAIALTSAKGQLHITEETNATALAQYLVGDGVTISNASLTFTGNTGILWEIIPSNEVVSRLNKIISGKERRPKGLIIKQLPILSS